jgi:hypothetical protein
VNRWNRDEPHRISESRLDNSLSSRNTARNAVVQGTLPALLRRKKQCLLARLQTHSLRAGNNLNTMPEVFFTIQLPDGVRKDCSSGRRFRKH